VEKKTEGADMGDILSFFFQDGRRLQTVFIIFVVIMGVIAMYNQVINAFQNSNLATHEYVNEQVHTEDTKVESELGEIRDKGNIATVTHATETATQTQIDNENHDQLNSIETKEDTLTNEMNDVSDRLSKVETRLDDIAPRQKHFNP
jgi:hypothetical protein